MDAGGSEGKERFSQIVVVGVELAVGHEECLTEPECAVSLDQGLCRFLVDFPPAVEQANGKCVVSAAAARCVPSDGEFRRLAEEADEETAGFECLRHDSCGRRGLVLECWAEC